MYDLNILPLAYQITCICGNVMVGVIYAFKIPVLGETDVL